MSRHFRRGLWLAAALMIAGLVTGVVAAHEARQVGDYHFIVGWRDEPAYEGTLNAVSVRVNRMDEGAMSMEMEGDNRMAGGDHDLVEAGAAMSIALETASDGGAGFNVRIAADGFAFAPESVGGEHVDGQGHAHVYVDGVKLGRIYTEWFHLDKLEPGEREIRVELNANSHGVYAWNGAAVEAVTRITAPEPSGVMAEHSSTEADAPMSIDFRLEPDELGGANLFVTELSGFRFAPENAGGQHVAGEGHAHVYVNGVKVGRMYGEAFHLGKMAEGMNDVQVTLNANDHNEYTWNGVPVTAEASIDIQPGMGGAGYGEAAAGGDHDLVEAGAAMSIALETASDGGAGFNVRIVADGFAFAPESVGGEHVDGQGHAHVYVDGVKLGRIYTEWFHLDKLEPGEREIRVELNANSHGVYSWNGAALEAVTRITAPESGGVMAEHSSTEADAPMSIDFRLEPDELGGANLFVTELSGFRFAPENAGGQHVAGEGHAHVYVNGVKVGRMYGEAFHLGKMAEGMNEVQVTLNANDHNEYTWNGVPVTAEVSIDIEPGMGGAGYGDASEDGEHSSMMPLMPSAGGVLASVAGQDGQPTMMMEPVEGLAGSLQVEVTYPSGGASRTLEMVAVFGDPGHYVAGLIPTAPGIYQFRVFGDVEGMAVDETFVSIGGGGGFDDIRSSEGLQFPEQLPELREVESGVRGAIETAQQAQDAALAAQDSGGNGLAIAALIVGIVAAVLGAGGLAMAMRGRQA